jgi:aldehyde dehydrogenase (NAD+)
VVSCSQAVVSSVPPSLGSPVLHPDRFFIGGAWLPPSGDSVFTVIDSTTEQPYFDIAEARAADLDKAIAAARDAFDSGPWPHMTHVERARYLRGLEAGIIDRAEDLAQIWPRQSGVLHSAARASIATIASVYGTYAEMATTFPFAEKFDSLVDGGLGMIRREPVGVVGAIIPWNWPLSLVSTKLAPALLAGCTAVIKASPEAPGEAYVLAEIIESLDFPPGVVNVVTADREVSELLVRDPRVDKISFTGSTAAGRRIAAIVGERVGRCTLELGGKSAAVILDDFDLERAASVLAAAGCRMSGQVCASLTRIIVGRDRHDEFTALLADAFSAKVVGDPFDETVEMGPLVSDRQRARVEGYIRSGVEHGATLIAGGGRPSHLPRGYFVEPTIFANVDNSMTIAQEEIFGPVLAVIPADSESHAITLANDSIYGLNGSVFTNDVDRAFSVASQMRTGIVGHNAFRGDIRIPFGGFKQSGIGREGGVEGLLPYLEVKSLFLEGVPSDALSG